MRFSSPCAIKWNYGRNYVMPVIFLRKRSLPRPSVLIIVRQSDQEAELSGATSNYVAEFVNGNSIGTVKFAADRRQCIPGCLCFNDRCPSPALLDQRRIKWVVVGASALFTGNFAFVVYPFGLRMRSTAVLSIGENECCRTYGSRKESSRTEKFAELGLDARKLLTG